MYFFLPIPVITIFLAVQLSKAELPDFVDWILVAFVAFYVAIHLILSVSYNELVLRTEDLGLNFEISFYTRSPL